MADKKIQIKHKNGTAWDLLFPVTKGIYVDLNNGTDLQDHLNTLGSTVSDKVDKVSGKVLSSNDYTDAEKTKLSGLKDHTSDIITITKNPIPVQDTAPDDSDLWFETLT